MNREQIVTQIETIPWTLNQTDSQVEEQMDIRTYTQIKVRVTRLQVNSRNRELVRAQVGAQICVQVWIQCKKDSSYE